MVGSGVHGTRPTVGPVDVAVTGAGVAALTDDVADGKVKLIRDGRVGCYGGALSARAVCVRARGGSLAEVRDDAFRIFVGRVRYRCIVSRFHGLFLISQNSSSSRNCPFERCQSTS